jgi:hypothetical protein
VSRGHAPHAQERGRVENGSRKFQAVTRLKVSGTFFQDGLTVSAEAAWHAIQLPNPERKQRPRGDTRGAVGNLPMFMRDGSERYTWMNSSPNSPQIGQEAGASPSSMCPHTGHRKNLVSVTSLPFFTASRAMAYSFAWTASARTA